MNDNNNNNEDVTVTYDNEPIVSRSMLLFGAAVCGMMLLISLWAWPQVEPPIPVNWGMDGQPNRWTDSKFEALILPALVMGGVLALLLVVPYISPRRANLERSRKAYQMVFYAMGVFMASVHAVAMQSILSGSPGNVGTIILAGIGLLFLVMGNVMSTVRSNFFFGIRTPWTLDSDYSWRKTHWMGGRLFMILGALFLLTGLFAATRVHAFSLLMASTVGMTLFLVAYSYYQWREDPERQASTSQ